MKMKPCPFCEGPPVAFVKRALYPYGQATRQDDYGDDGSYVCGVVFCHECGAQGPSHDEVLIFDRTGYERVLQEAIALWEVRDDRHRSLYVASGH